MNRLQAGVGRVRGRVGLLVLVPACFAALALSAAGASAAVPPAGFFGIDGWSYPSNSQSATLSAAGLGLVRGSLAWGDVQTTSSPSSRNWSNLDNLAHNAASGDYNLIIDLSGCAVWACGTVDAPPTGAELTAYESFVAAAVARYDPTSSFWNGQPHIPTITWQVWNEINAGVTWPNPTPAAYAAFLSQISNTIKSVDPNATVIMSGLDEFPTLSSGMELEPFLDGLYEQPTFRSSTAAIAVNAYAASATASVHVLDEARTVTLQNNDAARPLWVTEMGWASGGPASTFTVTPAVQNQYLVSSWDTMLACRPRWNLQHVVWFALQDENASTFDTPDYWGFHDGLLNVDGSAKPAYSSFLQFIGSQPLPSGGGSSCSLPGGDTLDIDSPHTVITSAPTYTHDTKSQVITFTATEDGQPVAGMHYQCSLDETPWTACSSPLNAANSRDGDHTLLVRGIDPEGTVDPSPASVTWVLDLTDPDTVITGHPKHATRKGVYTVRFKGVAPIPIASFQCRLNKRKWKTCASPYHTPKLKRGHYTIRVRAIDAAGNVDPTPAHVTFSIRRHRK
jgi:hypothetical protein